MDILNIDNNQALHDVCESFGQSSVICIDTEFHRETTYYPELALIQISDGSTTCCIDPLGISDFEPFLSLLRNQELLKVLHASQQDLEIFQYLFDTLPNPVFDTQIAAGLLGYGEQTGYAVLMKQILNVELDKSQSRTDWLKRPLSEEQLIYAANDVHYLAQAYPKMLDELNQLGRREWLDFDFAQLMEASHYQVDVTSIWKKVKGNQKLKGIQLAILQSLAAWREQTAQQRNRPRRRILPDEALVDMARLKPDTADKIKRLRSLNKTRLQQDDAEQLLTCIQQAQQQDKASWPKLVRRQKLNTKQEALADVLTALLKLSADEHRITPLNLASRKDIEALIQGQTDVALMQGWRYSHAGQQIEAFLKGQSLLQMSGADLALLDR